jgi:isochorismate synthase
LVIPFSLRATPGEVGGKSLNKDGYIQLVNKAISAMAENNWQKIVTSRCFHLNHASWDKARYIQSLRDRFPESYFIVFNHPVWGIWMAASPELLMKRSGIELETMALAGTLSAESSEDWGKKELNEHEVVRNMIVQTLTENDVNEIHVHPRNELYFKTVRHLQTKITGHYKGDDLKLIHALSPTPALAGMPVQQTVEWLVENEGYKRGLYGGVISVKEGREVYAVVLLRCIHVKGEQIFGFVGGGVMPNSNAEIEWNETVMKQNAFIFAADESNQ